MSSSIAGSPGTLAGLSAALSMAADDLARYPALASHAADFRSISHDALLPPLVMVMGSFNAGKSTLLNAMLGQELLSVDVLPATATVTMLRRGAVGEIIGHSAGLPVQTWPLAALPSLSSEGDPKCVKIRESLSFLEIPLDVALLDQVTLVDTPGLNSSHEAHTRATEDFVHRSQAVLWIVSCLQPLNDKERSWIQRLPDDVKLMVVVNQIDLLDPEEDSLPRVIERIQNNLQRPGLTVTAVSAELALVGLLKADPSAYAASLWKSFIADFNAHIIHADPVPRLRQTSRKVAKLFESVEECLAEHLAKSDKLRIKAKGGIEYHQDLQDMIGVLAEAECSLVHAFDVVKVVQSFNLPDGWGMPEALKLKREVLVGALLANAADQAQIDQEQKALSEIDVRWRSDSQQWNDEVEAYKTSGLFGGEPIIFDGEKKKLQGRGQRLTTRQQKSALEQDALYTKQRLLVGRLSRLKSDCSDVVAELILVVRSAMTEVVQESQDTVRQQKMAVSKLDEMMWLRTFAFDARKKPCWTLFGLGDPEHSKQPAGMLLCASLKRLTNTIDRILEEPWSLSIPQPLEEPNAARRDSTPESKPTTVRFQSRAISKSVWAILGLAVILLIAFVSIRYTTLRPSQQSGMENPQSSPTTSAIAVVPMDDKLSIQAALVADGYVADGAMTDFPGTTAGVVLHAQKASCSGSKPPCEMLFIFAGPRVVWSEYLPSASVVYNIQTSGPGQLAVQLKDHLSDGTETYNTLLYIWDGENISRTDTAANVATPDPSRPAPAVAATADAIPLSSTTPHRAEATPTPQSEIQSALSRWAGAMMTNDPQEEARCYAPQVERYFLQQNVDNAYILSYLTAFREKHAQFTSYSYSTPTITFNSDGTAKVELLKHFTLTVPAREDHDVTVHSELHFRRIDGSWKITFERDHTL